MRLPPCCRHWQIKKLFCLLEANLQKLMHCRKKQDTCAASYLNNRQEYSIIDTVY